ncbi:hypothetical protein KIN20_022280 [Parelaphostrongylus tenuis]|uniref:Uncharacterized protein n=1 Tax=Parelaphostrongylus tenuis TaxID=148309 RepID=A0AAD5QV34_PARTN|nr:hypothetical protein KIN20_022280 [Parelaphostrongylus tenuis]
MHASVGNFEDHYIGIISVDFELLVNGVETLCVEERNCDSFEVHHHSVVYCTFHADWEKSDS